MNKKVLILNGSPRKNGNTEMLVNSFAEGAEMSNNEIYKMDIQQMDIKPCLGCLQGGKCKETPCVQNDDMNLIYPLYVESDIMVFASPLYYWSFSAQLKMVIDRLFAVSEANNRRRPQKNCMLLLTAEGTSKRNFQPMVDYYESLLEHLGWTDCGRVLAGGFWDRGAIAESSYLDDAKTLGASIL